MVIDMKSLRKILKEKWYILILLVIFLLFLQIRFFTLGDKWLLAYDPYFHYRYTNYIVEQGALPSWDPMSYYPPGRPLNHPPFMHYLTGYLYILFGSGLGMSLMVFCKYMAGIYGALAVIPAFFLGKEFSDEKAGLLAAFFIGSSIAVLNRTMAGFYDTDGLVVFFTLLTMYLLVRSFKRKNILNYSFAALGLILFALTWQQMWYIPLIVIVSTFVYFFLLTFLGKRKWRQGKKEVMPSFSERVSKAFKSFKQTFIPLLGVFLGSSVIVWILGYNPFKVISGLMGFAFNPSQIQIVNVSVAELQNLNVFGGAWKQLFSKLSLPLIFSGAGAILLLKRNLKDGAILLTWLGVTFFAITRGIRFMLVFAPAAAVAGGVALSEAYKNLKDLDSFAPIISSMFLLSIFLSFQYPSAGIGLSIGTALLVLGLPKIWEFKEKIPEISKPILFGVAVLACLVTVSQATQVASQQAKRNPINSNWKKAYFFLKNETAKDSVVGTWWDPGHRIAAIAERRNIADGAHCPEWICDPGLNTRISHLGKIFVTSDEKEAASLLLKYRGNASEMYWIASDDLIGKFRWLQYFGTGCDGTGQLTPGGQQQCPLYSQMPIKNQKQNKLVYRGGVELDMSNQTIIPKIQVRGQKAVFEKMLIYQGETPKEISFKDMNNTIPGTLWVHSGFSYVVYIPPNLEDSIFTRMFFKEGKNLKYFEQVFRNNQVKIYKLKIDELPEEVLTRNYLT